MNLSGGTDLIRISRIEELLESKGEAFLRRIFTDGEIQYIRSKNLSPQTIAGIFAAKEAVSKAIGTGIGKVGWRDIEVCHCKKGKPYIELHREGLRLSRRLRIDGIDISISHEGEYAMAFAIAGGLRTPTDVDIPKEIRGILPKRNEDSHKGSFGRVGIVAGSRGMVGASYLSTMAALRTGSGLVYSIVPRGIEDILSIKLVEAIIKSVEDGGRGHFTMDSYEELRDIFRDMDVLAIGPGMGVDEDRVELVGRLLMDYEGPIVLDADGINCLSKGNISSILANRDGKTVITPHLGELSRLLDMDLADIREDLVGHVRNIAQKHDIIVVVKGANTMVADGDGRLYTNTTGNPGMATAGSGDVLTGMIASLIGQGMEPYEAAISGVYCHGLAGDLAEEDKGQYGMISRDILENIPYTMEILIGRE
ncbi:MAG: NAD(P)H-hydrate dehydratase [Tissierellia bacterium]|nr:NAD(P)H-hydrate dehydratase [Tissierellia bacterium]